MGFDEYCCVCGSNFNSSGYRAKECNTCGQNFCDRRCSSNLHKTSYEQSNNCYSCGKKYSNQRSSGTSGEVSGDCIIC